MRVLSGSIPKEFLLSTASIQTEPILRPVMPELDSIRGIAILAVVFYHEFYSIGMGQPLSRWQHVVVLAAGPGRMGVNLFFVLSGFLITGILLKSCGEHGYYKRFYVRRALRIFPIYFLLLIVLAVLGYPRSFLILSLLYLSNLVHLFGVPLAYNVLWSLAVEEHFYFVWPFMVRTLSRKNLELLAIAIIAASPLIRLISYRHAAAGDQDWMYYTWNNMDGLAAGAFLALFIRRTNSSRQSLRRACAVAVALAAVIWAIGIPLGILTRKHPAGIVLQTTPWQCLCFATVGIFLLLGTTKWRFLVRSSALGFYGYISYGLYLIHTLVFEWCDRLNIRRFLPGFGFGAFTDILVRLAYFGFIATTIAWLSRKYFEELFLRKKPTA
jgi:peptidoglycan/LPS O-acetylase OafA/YrhL